MTENSITSSSNETTPTKHKNSELSISSIDENIAENHDNEYSSIASKGKIKLTDPLNHKNIKKEN